MPFTFLAHQAPVLPLKLWRPRWFSGAGLAIGSMAPDFDKFIEGADATRYGHTLLGQLVYCLPLSLLIYWLLTRVAAPALARFAPDLGALRLRDYAVALADGRPPARELVTVAASVLVGSVSHVALDGFTHADPRVVALFPITAARTVVIGGRTHWVPTLLQWWASAVGAAATLAMMCWLARRRLLLAWAGLDPAAVPPRAERSPAARGFWAAAAALAVAAGGAFVALHVALAGGHAPPRLLYSLALRLPLIGFVAVCVAAALTGRRGAAPTLHRPAPPPPSR